MPKRPLSAYIFFGNDKRAGVTRKNKDAKMTDISKLLGEIRAGHVGGSRGVLTPQEASP